MTQRGIDKGRKREKDECIKLYKMFAFPFVHVVKLFPSSVWYQANEGTFAQTSLKNKFQSNIYPSLQCFSLPCRNKAR